MNVELLMSFPFISGSVMAIAHVLSGPDHLAAVTPFAVHKKTEGWRVGLFWGIGHVLGMLAIGLLFLFFKDLIPVDRISNYSELIVGFTLIGIACWTFYRLFVHKQKSEHKNQENVIADMIPLNDTQQTGIIGKKQRSASFFIGLLHGFAGIAHFLLLLPALGFTTIGGTVSYLIGFAVGTIVAMLSFTYLISYGVNKYAKNHSAKFYRKIGTVSGLFALTVGVYWVVLN